MTDWGRTGNGRIALVTGGGTGIGLAIARGLSAEGYSVVITGRRVEVLETAAAAISAETGNVVRAVACDVGKPDEVAARESGRGSFGPRQPLDMIGDRSLVRWRAKRMQPGPPLVEPDHPRTPISDVLAASKK